MALLAASNPTLADVAKRTAPDGSLDMIVEILNTTNEALVDMPWVEGNLPTGHRTSIRTGLPAVTWRKLYGGVQPTKSTTAQITDNCGMLEAYAEVDKALADLNGNTAAFRLSEDKSFVEAMGKEMAETLFYGNEGTEPEAYTGLAPRYNTLSTGTAQSADNVITGGGSGSDNTSVWLIGWASDKIAGIYPKASKAGLSMKDLGEVTIENADGSNGRMQAYRSHYRWDCGMMVKDWRYAVRICNIDLSNLTADASSGAKLIELMIKAHHKLPSLNNCRPVFYANRDIATFLHLQMANKSNVNLTFDSAGGGTTGVLRFNGIPLRRCDAILNTEATVS